MTNGAAVSYRNRAGTDALGRVAAAVLLAIAIAGTTLTNASAAAAIAIFFALLVVAHRSVVLVLVVIVYIAPWMSLATLLVGGRFVPVGIDLFTVALALLLLLSRRPQPIRDRWVRVAQVSAFACIAIAFFELANPKGLTLVGAMDGYRTTFLPMLAVPIGLYVGARCRELPHRLLVALVLSSVWVAGMGIRQALAMSSIDEMIMDNAKADVLVFTMTGTGAFRAFSPLPGPFHFGAMMMVGLVSTASMLVERFRASYLVMLMLLFAGLAFNATRLNWAGTAVALVVGVLLSLSRATFRQWLPRVGLAVAALAMLLWAFSQIQEFVVLRRFAQTFFANPTENTSYVYRVLSWSEEIIPAIRASPAIGYGTGMAKDGLGPYSSHNIFLKLLIEGGVVLLVAYGCLLVSVTGALLRRPSDPAARAAVALLIGIHVAGMFGPMMDAYPANLLIWLLAGVALGTSQLSPTHVRASRVEESSGHSGRIP